MLRQLQLLQQQRTNQVKAWNRKERFPWEVWAWLIIRFSSFSLDLLCLLLNWTDNQKNQSPYLQLSGENTVESQRYKYACAQ